MTQENQTPAPDDEIDLKELALTVWAARGLIMLCVLCAVFLASAYLHNAERKYTVSFSFQPMESDGGGARLGGLSGLASLAGVSLPTAGSSDFQTFRVLLQAEEVAAELMKDQAIIRRIFVSEWSEESQTFKQPEPTLTRRAIGNIKALLTGETTELYIPPNAPRLSEWLSKAFSSSEDRDTGFLRLSSETSNPKLMLEVITAVTQITDRIIKDRFLAGGRNSVEFYQKKIAAARSRESREALAQLIMQEEQKLMLASNGNFFVAKPLTTPSVSLRPTSPKSSLVLALAIVLGSFLGAAVSLIRKALQND